jgi:hypothetical protein
VLSVVWVFAVATVAWKTFPGDDWIPVSSIEHGPREDYGGKPVPRELVYYETIGYACLMALVAPALVLAFGSAVVWAFRGSRP